MARHSHSIFAHVESKRAAGRPHVFDADIGGDVIVTPITITTVRDRAHLMELLDGDREFSLNVRNTEDDA